MIKSYKREATFQQYTSEGFEEKLGKFYKFIEDFTYIDEELNPEERHQLLQSRFTNGYTPFLQLVRKLFGHDVQTQDIKAVFRKIATNPDVEVDWGELFGINASVQEELHEIKQPNEMQDVFTLDSKTIAGQAGGDRRSRENIKCITYSPELNLYITVTLHGIACHWNRKFRFKSSIDIGESSWVTGCCILPDLRRIVISTERSLVIWNFRAKGKEMNLFHIKPLDAPQCVTRVPWKNNPGTEDYVLFGDEQGYINLMTLNVKDFQRTRSVEKDHADVSNVIDPAELIREIVRRKFHNDWVMQIKYFPQLQMFGSCSSDKDCSFVLSRLDNLADNRPVREMSLPKGVNCFAYCVRANAIVTGGVDKTLRIWHPIILTRPTGKLIGHLFTVTDISVNERDQHLISLSTARIFRIWDIQKLQCLQTFAVGENLTAENRTCVMHFDSKYDRLITGTNIIELWPLFRDQDAQVVPHTHEQAISYMIYNEHLNQMVSACKECILKVWEMETGHLVYTLTEAHGSRSAYVTAMATDATGHRLISAGQDGSLRLWDCISSHLLKSYDPATSQRSSICGIAYQELQDIKCIFAATVNRSVRVYLDDADEIKELYVLSDSVQIQVEHVRLGNTPEFPSGRSRKFSNEKSPNKLGLKKRDSCLTGIFLSYDITCMGMSHADNLLAAGFSNGSIFIWNTVDQNIISRISHQQLSQSASYSRGWGKDSICCLKFLVHETKQMIRDDMRSRSSTLTVLQSTTSRHSVSSNISAMKETLVSRAEAVRLSVNGEHPAYSVVSRDASETAETGKEAVSYINKRTVLLLICSENGCVSVTEIDGTVLMQTSVANVVQRTRCVTSVCTTKDDMEIFIGDTMGYLSCWNLKKFWEIRCHKNYVDSDVSPVSSNKEKELENSVEHTLSWRAHLTQITNLEHINNYDLLLSASIDGSVRMWHCKTGHFLGFFGQMKTWYLSKEMLIPPSPVQPCDITESPLKSLKRLRMTSMNAKPEAAKCPLAFDNRRWTSAPDLSFINEKESPRDKKFFSSLSKPKHYNSHLENSAVKASYDKNAVFRTLPVYKISSPKRLKTPGLDLREPTWFGNLMKPAAQNKRKKNAVPYRMKSPQKEVKPVARFPHIVPGKKSL